MIFVVKYHHIKTVRLLLVFELIIFQSSVEHILPRKYYIVGHTLCFFNRFEMYHPVNITSVARFLFYFILISNRYLDLYVYSLFGESKNGNFSHQNLNSFNLREQAYYCLYFKSYDGIKWFWVFNRISINSPQRKINIYNKNIIGIPTNSPP